LNPIQKSLWTGLFLDDQQIHITAPVHISPGHRAEEKDPLRTVSSHDGLDLLAGLLPFVLNQLLPKKAHQDWPLPGLAGESRRPSYSLQ